MILPNYLRNSSPWLSEFSRLFESGLRQITPSHPDLRVYEGEDGWTLELDYPGVPKTNLSLKVENGALQLEDDREGSTLPKYRLPLSDEIDPERITASLNHGVLSLHLPKSQSPRKQIEIL